MPDFEKYAAAKEALGVPAEALDAMMEQLLLVLIQRLGGKVTIPVSEIDNTGDLIMTMEMDAVSRDFTFQVSKKN